MLKLWNLSPKEEAPYHDPGLLFYNPRAIPTSDCIQKIGDVSFLHEIPSLMRACACIYQMLACMHRPSRVLVCGRSPSLPCSKWARDRKSVV